MPRARREPPSTDSGPSLRAVPFFAQSDAGPVSLLNRRQRQRLTEISTRVRVPPRMVLYREDTVATTMFFNAGGVVKTFRDLPSGRRWVTGFFFPEDVFGLAQNGVYVRTAQTVTEATLYRVKTEVLAELLRNDPDLEYQFLVKAAHELREAQRQALVVGRRDAVGRVAMFIRQLEQRGVRHASGGGLEIDMPMTRSDVANYLGLSPEAVSRATRMLERRGIVKFTERHRVRIVDRLQFDRLVARV
ncbi:MAG TPA: Crp/Fnr family transcriptional regulator [Vicinamibacterales bacterium]|nr:Crp/Fnr family transcriptional regulator [Vicinamibacterales bacterium]